MRNILISTIVASALATSCLAKETTTTNTNVQHINAVTVNNATAKAKQEKSEIKLVKEAIDSLKFAYDALNALNKNDKKSASANLEKALGKLEVTLSSKKVPEFLAVDSMVRVYEFIGSSESIEKAVKLAKNLLDDNKVQAAKKILEPLESEIDIAVVNLPLATYPDALKETAKLIHDDKIEEAKVVLATALNTLVTVETTLPIPLLKATDLIAAAADIAQKDTKEAKLYLEAAQEELKVAEYLGYTSSSDVTYKILDEAIDKLKSDITSKEVKSFFTNLQNKMKDFSSKIFSSEDEKKTK